MKAIYSAMSLEKVVVNKEKYKSGEQVVLTYELTNSSSSVLLVPENRDYSRPFHLAGIHQKWIERLGADSTIPTMPKRIARDGSKYAAGGAIIPTGPRLSPFESIPFRSTSDTGGFPAGTYRIHVEYKDLKNNTLQTASTEFEIE